MRQDGERGVAIDSSVIAVVCGGLWCGNCNRPERDGEIHDEGVAAVEENGRSGVIGRLYNDENNGGGEKRVDAKRSSSVGGSGKGKGQHEVVAVVVAVVSVSKLNIFSVG